MKSAIEELGEAVGHLLDDLDRAIRHDLARLARFFRRNA